MSLVWILPALSVSWLTIAVVEQLLEEAEGKVAGRLIASALGAFLFIEGALVLRSAYGFTADAWLTGAMHGVVLMVAAAGIWLSRVERVRACLIRTFSGFERMDIQQTSRP